MKKFKNKITALTISGSALLPFIVYAQTDLAAKLDEIKDLLNQIIPILMVIATIVFLWGGHSLHHCIRRRGKA